ncbi:hypothetical protein ABZP36_033564, partial [Zizania latifolia]
AGSAPVYCGRLEDGREVAVKRLSTGSQQGAREFRNEANLSRVQHRNLVNLIGYCAHGADDKILFSFSIRPKKDFTMPIDRSIGAFLLVLFLPTTPPPSLPPLSLSGQATDEQGAHARIDDVNMLDRSMHPCVSGRPWRPGDGAGELGGGALGVVGASKDAVEELAALTELHDEVDAIGVLVELQTSLGRTTAPSADSRRMQISTSRRTSSASPSHQRLADRLANQGLPGGRLRQMSSRLVTGRS